MNVVLKYIQRMGLVLPVGLFVFLGLESSRADISFVPVTWSLAGNAEGWSSRSSVGAVAQSSGTLNMHFIGAGPAMESDAMVANNQAGYNGDYTAYQTLQVSFNFKGYATSAQSLYFQSTAIGGSTWSRDFTVPDSGWHNYAVSLSDPSGWIRLSGVESFATALTSVNMIGIAVLHNNAGSAFDYNLDEWTYSNPVPEPGAVAMLFSALGSLGFVCRFSRRKAPLVAPKV